MDEKEIVSECTEKGGARLMKAPTKKLEKRILLALCAFAAVFVVVCVIAAASRSVYPGVTVLGQKLGGMSADEAAAALRADAAYQSQDAGITFTAEEDSFFVSYTDLGMKLFAEETAQAAYDYGRSGGALRGGWCYLCGMFGKQSSIAPAWDYDKIATHTSAHEIAKRLSVEAIAAAAVACEDGLHLTSPRNGRAVNENEVLALMTDAERCGKELSETVEVPFTVQEMSALELTAVQEQYAAAAVNAGYDAQTNSITPEQIHVDFDAKSVQEQLDAEEPGSTIVVGTAQLPSVTAAELEKVLFRDVLSSYTTKVGGAEGRHKNVRVTAGKINGIILNSGESLKYSELVMPFTEANGYFPAPGYLQGKTVDMIGGGACQASSTLYAASLYANLEIVQRVNHGFASDYIGLGLDATVAEGGPEFEVRNNTDYPIKVEATFYTSGSKDYITVKLIGTKTNDNYVKIRTDVLSTTPFEEEIVETDELAPGQRVVEQTAYTGYLVKTYRQIYSADGTMLSETFEATSKYNVRNRIIKVGKSAETGGTPVTPDTPAEQPTETPAEEIPYTEPVTEQEIPGWLNW